MPFQNDYRQMNVSVLDVHGKDSSLPGNIYKSNTCAK